MWIYVIEEERFFMPKLSRMTRRDFTALIDVRCVGGEIRNFEEAREESWETHTYAFLSKRECVEWIQEHLENLFDCLGREELAAYVKILEDLTGKTAFFVNEYKRGDTNANYVILAKDIKNAMRQAKGFYTWCDMTLSDKHGNDLAYKSWLGRWERAEDTQ